MLKLNIKSKQSLDNVQMLESQSSILLHSASKALPEKHPFCNGVGQSALRRRCNGTSEIDLRPKTFAGLQERIF